MTPSFKIAAAGLMLAVLLGAAACSPEAQTAPGDAAALSLSQMLRHAGRSTEMIELCMASPIYSSRSSPDSIS